VGWIASERVEFHGAKAPCADWHHEALGIRPIQPFAEVLGGVHPQLKELEDWVCVQRCSTAPWPLACGHTILCAGECKGADLLRWAACGPISCRWMSSWMG
jgi:hypothetical protein